MQRTLEATSTVNSSLSGYDSHDIVNDSDLVSISVPSVLHNIKFKDHYTYLHERPHVAKIASLANTQKFSRHDNDGKRWSRRKKNDHFVDNPHIAPPTKSDYSLPIPRIQSTFPKPLPAYLPRNSWLPSNTKTDASSDVRSAMSGIFSLGLKGVRRELRRSGVKVQNLVREIEDEILDWLLGGTILLSESDNSKTLNQIDTPGKPIGRTGTILEVVRNPLQMIWYVEGSGFARYIIHCCARYHAIVSYSKEHSGRRLTYLLRPNVLRPDRTVLRTLETPPPTDHDVDTSVYGLDTDLDSMSNSELDAISEVACLSDEYEHTSRPLTSLSERSDMPNQVDNTVTSESLTSIDNLEATEDTCGDGDKSESESGFALSESTDSLSFNISSRLPRDTAVWSRDYISNDRRVYGDQSSLSVSSPKESQFKSGVLHQSNIIDEPRGNRRSFYDYLFA